VAEDNVYQFDEQVPLQATVKDANGALTNATVVLEVRAPDGTTTTPATTNSSTGIYTAQVQASQKGLWWYSFVVTGTVNAVEQNSFYVEQRYSQTAGVGIDPLALTTLEDARDYVFRDVRDDSQDRELVRLINAYSRSIYKYTQREWLPQTAAATRIIEYLGDGFLSLAPYEARTVTGVTLYTDLPTASQVALIQGSSTVEGQWRLGPRGATPEGTYLWLDIPRTYMTGLYGGQPTIVDGDYIPYGYARPRHSFQVSVTGDWGVATTLAGVPSDVQLACLIAVKDAFENPAGFPAGQFGAESFTEEAPDSRGDYYQAGNLSAETRLMLTPYRRASGYVFA
jgi:hypothetical protein